MNHVQPQKCWVCTKPMMDTCIGDSPMDCDECGLGCCGSCLFEHVRRAHPKNFMINSIPRLKIMRDEPAYQRIVREQPGENNVIHINFKKP